MYGLAEHTVYVCKTNTDLHPLISLDRSAFDASEIVIIERYPNLADAQLELKASSKILVSCGRVDIPPVDILIVDPSDLHIVPENKVILLVVNPLSICLIQSNVGLAFIDRGNLDSF
jgi:hypothetical protein